MGRWEPDAAGRLRAAALDLFLEQGYAATTVAEIAERAGVTSRTFFRHFADKREVLFSGADPLGDAVVAAVAAGASGAAPFDLVRAANGAMADVIGHDRGWSCRRYEVLTANPELMERELAKLATLATTLRGALAARGTDDAQARLVAETGIAVFRAGYEAWIEGPDDGVLTEVLDAALDRLLGLASGLTSSD